MSDNPKLTDFTHKVDLTDLPADYRSAARRLALQFLHHLTVQGQEAPATLEHFLSQYAEQPHLGQLAKEWILGTWHRREEFDRMIQAASKNWDITRINIVDRNNLRLGLYQLLYCPDIPASVVINEAVELAKTFSTAQAPGFVNAILDNIREKIESKSPDEQTQ